MSIYNIISISAYEIICQKSPLLSGQYIAEWNTIIIHSPTKTVLKCSNVQYKLFDC